MSRSRTFTLTVTLAAVMVGQSVKGEEWSGDAWLTDPGQLFVPVSTVVRDPLETGHTSCENRGTRAAGDCGFGDNGWLNADWSLLSTNDSSECDGGFFVRGWIDQGFTWNPDSPGNRSNLPQTFNDRSNEYQLNQLYLQVGRQAATDGCEWDIGGQVDVLYGTDYFFTTATGLETHQDGTPKWNSANGPRSGGTAALYGVALPQAYAEIYAPLGNGVTFKVGHFYTIIGDESVAAPENFFYSHSYTMQYGEPFTHTGVLATTALTDQITVNAGVTRGWDNWEDPGDDLGFLGGIEWTSCDSSTSLAFALHSGDEDVVSDDNRTVYSFVLKQQLSDRLRYVFQHDFGVQENGQLEGPGDFGTAKWYGINQNLIYDVSDSVSVGTRFEWFRDQEHARILGIPIAGLASGGNYYNLTLGANWRPAENITIRPELRWDWSNTVPPLGTTGVYDDFSDKNQFTLGADIIFRF